MLCRFKSSFGIVDVIGVGGVDSGVGGVVGDAVGDVVGGVVGNRYRRACDRFTRASLALAESQCVKA